MRNSGTALSQHESKPCHVMSIGRLTFSSDALPQLASILCLALVVLEVVNVDIAVPCKRRTSLFVAEQDNSQAAADAIVQRLGEALVRIAQALALWVGETLSIFSRFSGQGRRTLEACQWRGILVLSMGGHSVVDVQKEEVCR